MNFYKHYIGDFQRDTGHLSLTERGAYLALIHHYYATEKPLPNDLNSLCRIAGAISKVERAAVKAVIGFFVVVDSGLMHHRIESELEKVGEISNTNREIAIAREAKRRAEKDARIEHEQSTNRATNLPRIEHEQSTNQTPDTSKPLSTANAVEGASKLPPCPHQEIISLYHTILPMLPQVREWNDQRQGYMRSRWKDHPTIDYWQRFFAYVAKSVFLTGQAEGRPGAPPFVADLEWLIRPTNFVKVIEGKYHQERVAA